MTISDVHAAAPQVAPIERPWRDPRRAFWPLALVVPLLPFLAGGLVAVTGWSGFWWIGPVLIFGLMPLLDRALGLDTLNPPEDATAALDADRYYRHLTYAYLPLQFASLVWACAVWASGELSTFAALGLAATVGCVAGIAINTAHELGHKHPTLERWLAKIALAQSAYGHFYVEHNRGHHQRVSTPDDPASSRFGESFYAFVPRTVIVQHVVTKNSRNRDVLGNPTPIETVTGSGKATFFRDGKVWRGTWTRRNAASPTVYRVGSKEFLLAPGQVWIMLLPTSAPLTVR